MDDTSPKLLPLLINPTTGDVYRPTSRGEAVDFMADGWKLICLVVRSKS